jgi:hypothetical protein
MAGDTIFSTNSSRFTKAPEMLRYSAKIRSWCFTLEPLSGQHLGGHTAAAADRAVHQGRLLRVDFPQAAAQFRQGDPFRTGDVFGFVLLGLSHIEQGEGIRGLSIHKGLGLIRVHRFYGSKELFPAHRPILAF